jgi:hypothetical protein
MAMLKRATKAEARDAAPADDALTVDKLEAMGGFAGFPEVAAATARLQRARAACEATPPPAFADPLHVQVQRSEARAAAAQEHAAAEAALKAAREAAFATVRGVLTLAHVREAIAVRAALATCLDALQPILRIEGIARAYEMRGSSLAPGRSALPGAFGGELRGRLQRELDRPRFAQVGPA